MSFFTASKEPPKFENRIDEVAKLILAGGNETDQGIVLKNGEKICGIVTTFTNGVWSIKRTGDGLKSDQTYDGLDQIRSIDFVNTCPSPSISGPTYPTYLGCYNREALINLVGPFKKRPDTCLRECHDSGYQYAVLISNRDNRPDGAVKCSCAKKFQEYSPSNQKTLLRSGCKPCSSDGMFMCGNWGAQWPSVYQLK